MSKRRKAALIILLIGVAFVLVGAPIYFLWPKFRASGEIHGFEKRLDADYTRAINAGVPLVAEELAIEPPVSDSENAAALFEKACASLPKKLDPNFQYNAETGNYKEASALLKPAEPAMDLAVKASAFPKCEVKRDWDLGPDLLFPEFGRAKQLAKCLAARAVIKAGAGDHDGAIVDLRACSSLGADCVSDSTIIGGLVDIVIQKIMVRGLEHCLPMADSAVALRKYESLLNGSPPNIDCLMVLKHESYLQTAVIRNMDPGSNGETNFVELAKSGDLRRSGVPESSTARGIMAAHLELWSEVFERAQKETDPYRLLSLPEEVLERQEVGHESIFGLEALVTPVIRDAGQAFELNKISWPITDALCKVMIYKKEHGAYPASLAEVGFNKIDPFSGKLFRYLVKGDEVRIYSLGKDRVDNNGLRKSEMPARKSSQFDEAASYPPIAARKTKVD